MNTNAQNNLSTPKSWAGVWTALVTPLKPSKSGVVELDDTSLKNLIEEQIDSGVRGLVIAGSTGEGSLLATSQYKELLTQAKKHAANRIPLVAGLGIGGTRSACEAAQLASTLGYQGVLAAPPAYIKTPQRGLVEHFLEVASVGLPVCLYEIAGRSASSIEVSTLKTLVSSAHPSAKNLVALKDASANLSRALEQKRILGDHLALLSGDDGTFLPFLECGGSGVISVVSHVAAREWNNLWKAHAGNNHSQALSLQTKLLPLVDAIFVESNPIPIKALLHALGRISSPTLCPPLIPLQEKLLGPLLAAHKECLS